MFTELHYLHCLHLAFFRPTEFFRHFHCFSELTILWGMQLYKLPPRLNRHHGADVLPLVRQASAKISVQVHLRKCLGSLNGVHYGLCGSKRLIIQPSHLTLFSASRNYFLLEEWLQDSHLELLVGRTLFVRKLTTLSMSLLTVRPNSHPVC